MKQPGVYILQSVKNGRYYVGSTDDVNERLKTHNSGWVKATVNMKPLELRVFIPCQNITEAKQAEYRLKKYKRRDILEKVTKDGLFPWQYMPE